MLLLLSGLLISVMCYNTGGSPALWTTFKEWLKRDPCELSCPLYYHPVCAGQNISDGIEYVVVDNECVLENHNACFGTSKYLVI